MARKVDRFSDDDGRGKHFASSVGRSTNVMGEDTLSRNVNPGQDQPSAPSASQDHSNKSPSRTETASGSSVTGRSRMPSAGLLAAKAQWRAMESSGRRRLRRANSQEEPQESSTAQQENIESDATPTISGHPLAAESGVPMPSIQDMAPIRRSLGGVATFTAATPSDARPSPASRPPLTVETETASGSEPRVQVPDYVTGRGGDGITGNDLPAVESYIDVQERQAMADCKRKILLELKSILTWYAIVYR